jgi:hypothetical protein
MLTAGIGAIWSIVVASGSIKESLESHDTSGMKLAYIGRLDFLFLNFVPCLTSLPQCRTVVAALTGAVFLMELFGVFAAFSVCSVTSFFVSRQEIHVPLSSNAFVSFGFISS